MASKERLPGEQDLGELATTLGERFIQRRDLYAQQLEDGRYAAVKRPLRRNHLLAHLRGTMTLGAYVLDENSRTSYLVVDADDDPDWRRLNGLSRVLGEMECASYLEQQPAWRPSVALLLGTSGRERGTSLRPGIAGALWH